MNDFIKDGLKDTPPAQSGGIEKRRYPRFSLIVEIDMVSDHNFFTGFIENVSSGGLFIATHELLDVGSELDLRFSLPGGKEVQAAARVTWLRENLLSFSECTSGMGVRFLSLAEEDEKAINEFIRQREPIFHEI